MKIKRKNRKGFLTADAMLGLFLLAVSLIAGVSLIKKQIDDQAAEGSAKYMLSVRSALIDFQVKHEAFLAGIDTSEAPPGTYPPPPSFLQWQAAGNGNQGQVAQGSVQNLIDEGFLPKGFATYMPLGQKALWTLHRSGICGNSSTDCNINAYVYSCHPISSQRSTYLASTSCQNVIGTRAEAKLDLVGQMIMSTEGYGGNDFLNKTHFSGPLLGTSLPRNLLPGISSDPGRVVVTASLNATPFQQFIRQGDTRHIVFRNSLTVDGIIQGNSGLLLSNDPVRNGDSCAGEPEGLYASTESKTLATCVDGKWFDLSNYLVRNVINSVKHGDRLPPVNCPPAMTSWQQIAIKSNDFRITGSDINVHGTLQGRVSGTGSVNQSGSYNINGNFNGDFSNQNSSFIDVKQSATISPSGIVSISPNGANAEASVMQGCRAL